MTRSLLLRQRPDPSCYKPHKQGHQHHRCYTNNNDGVKATSLDSGAAGHRLKASQKRYEQRPAPHPLSNAFTSLGVAMNVQMLACATSALRSEADMAEAREHVRLGPKADIRGRSMALLNP